MVDKGSSLKDRFMQEFIRHNFKIIKEEQAELQERLIELRNECKHPGVVCTPKGNTGNYDPGADCYWDEFKCPDCGEFWRSDKVYD